MRILHQEKGCSFCSYAANYIRGGAWPQLIVDSQLKGKKLFFTQNAIWPLGDKFNLVRHQTIIIVLQEAVKYSNQFSKPAR